jgi:TPR repeat protein
MSSLAQTPSANDKSNESTEATPTPPYIAFKMRDNLAFSRSSCIDSARKILVRSKFSRFKELKTPILLAGRGGRNNYAKVLIGCFAETGLVTVTLVTDSGSGIERSLDLLNSIIEESAMKELPKNESNNKATAPTAEVQTSPANNNANADIYQKALKFEQNQKFNHALKIYRPLAEVGEMRAQYRLGLCYQEGQGVPQNFAKAYVWFSLAASQGDAQAKKARDNLKEKFKTEELNKLQEEADKIYNDYAQ